MPRKAKKVSGKKTEKTDELSKGPPEEKKMKLGIKELDKHIGGLKIPSAILIEGPPGSGKTPFAIAFAHANLLEGRKIIYICTNNFPDEIKEIAKNIGYNVDEAIFVDGYSWIIGEKSDYPSVSALDLTGFLEFLDNVLKKEVAEGIILDALSTLFLYHEEKSVQKFVQALVAMIKKRRACLLLLVEKGTCSESMEATLAYLTDGKIEIGNNKIIIARMVGRVIRRREFLFTITPKGFEVT